MKIKMSLRIKRLLYKTGVKPECIPERSGIDRLKRCVISVKCKWKPERSQRKSGQKEDV